MRRLLHRITKKMKIALPIDKLHRALSWALSPFWGNVCIIITLPVSFVYLRSFEPSVGAFGYSFLCVWVIQVQKAFQAYSTMRGGDWSEDDRSGTANGRYLIAVTGLTIPVGLAMIHGLATFFAFFIGFVPNLITLTEAAVTRQTR